MILPSNTCPRIDAVVECINDAIKIADKCYNTLEEADLALGEVIWQLKDLEAELEIIREANADLRQAAEEEHEARKEAEKTISSLEKEAHELIGEIDRLREIEWMYNDLD